MTSKVSQSILSIVWNLLLITIGALVFSIGFKAIVVPKGLITFQIPISDTFLHGSGTYTGKASKGEVVVVYFEPLATQHVEASGQPEG